MREILKTLAALCAVLFILAGVPTWYLFNIERQAFSSATYEQAFEDQGLYDRMPALLANTLSTTLSQNGNMPPFLRELSAEEWQTTISTLLPPEELRAMTNQTLDSAFDYLNFKSNSVIVSLLPIKAKLAGEGGVNVIREFLRTQPECTIEQLAQMGLGFLGGNIALCNPPEEAIGLLAPFIQSQLQAISAAFPNEIALVPGGESGAPNDPRQQLQWVRSAVVFSPFFLFLLLLAIAVLAVRSLQELFLWWGWPLLITGTLSLLIALVGAPLIGWFLQFLIQTQGAVFLPIMLASTIGETASAVARQILVPIAIQAFVIALIGLIMVVVGTFFMKRERYVVT
ncbi:MAG TPA: hypothetical protein VJ785_07145 [Anaerolineales bacterium]|nr:hypothetical protein [Anaerolineales bacterium]